MEDFLRKNTQTSLFKGTRTLQTGKSNSQNKDDKGQYPFYIRSENMEYTY